MNAELFKRAWRGRWRKDVGMIASPDGAYVLSSLGWVDGASMWCFDARSDEIQSFPVGTGGFLELFDGTDGHFEVAHHPDGGGISVSIRNWAEPGQELDRVAIDEEGSLTTFGDESTLRRAPAAYTFRTGKTDAPYSLLLVGDAEYGTQVQHLDWFNGENYDLVWQGVIQAEPVPGQSLVLIAIQRDSAPAIWDPHKCEVVGHLNLAGRNGNPTVRFADDCLWADDYDTLLRIDPANWSVAAKARLQDAGEGTQQFIGNWGLRSDGSCVVARPFSGDAIALEPAGLKMTHRCELGREPLDVAALDDGRVVARDWKTGELLIGTLEPAS